MWKSKWAFAGIVALLAGPVCALVPRTPFDKAAGNQLDESQIVESITLKFQEGTHVRLRDGQLVALEPDSRESERQSSFGLSSKSIEADLSTVADAVASTPAALGVERMFSQSESTLSAWRASAESRSSLELADLDLYYRIPVVGGSALTSVANLLSTLNSLGSVEIAQANGAMSTPSDIAPPTPNFDEQGYQGYLDSASSGGIDARYAWTIPGGRGQGISIVDIEFAWRTTHEDFPAVFYAQGNNPSSGTSDHGASVIGILAAPDNGYGVTGIANQASVGLQGASFVPWGDAILRAAQQVGVGGVVLVELQTSAGIYDSFCPCAALNGTCRRELVPAEFRTDVFDAIRMVTAGGTIVVEAAANGSNSLDPPHYFGYFDRNVRDSGAILVAASNGPGGVPICTSNYGSRIDVHGWGKFITTLGQARFEDNIFDGGGDPNQIYTSNFANTSGASPMVAGAAASVQGVALAAGSPLISPLAMRQLLRETGTPQAPDARLIGPIPNLRAALGSMGGPPPPTAAFSFYCSGRTCTFDGSGSTGANTWTWSFGDNTSGSGVNVVHTYSSSADFTVRLTVQGAGGASFAEHLARVGLPPVASFTITCSGLFCQLDASSSAVDRGPVTYSVGWSDSPGGSFTSNPIQTNTYRQLGNYTIQLAVRDALGQSASTSQIVHVGSASPASTVGYAKDGQDFKLRLYHATGSGSPLNVSFVGNLTSGLPFTGDWNGDGIDTVGYYDSATSTFNMKNANTSSATPWNFTFSSVTGVLLPISGDWDGNGSDSVGLYDPSTGIFRLRNSNSSGGADLTFTWTGAASSWLPIAGDWNGDGITSVGLYDPTTSTFHLRNLNTSGGADLTFSFGTQGVGLLPNAGDWDGDGWDSIGVYNPVTFVHELRNMNTPGPADWIFTFGVNGGKPVAGDWDGVF